MSGIIPSSRSVSEAQHFEYRNLKREPIEIRLIRIISRKASSFHLSSQIQCDVFHAGLEAPPPYHALSYTWGKESDPVHSIILDGCVVQVRQNLWEAMNRLQSDDEDVTVWIDALCIDQSNISERNHQVQNMGRIYQQASLVIVWLGPADEDSREALNFVRKFWENRESHEWFLRQAENPDTLRQLECLSRVFNRPYWQRIWIVQEITFAKVFKVLCGDDSISGSVLSGSQKLMSEHRHLTSGLTLSRIISNDPALTESLIWRGPSSVSLSGYLSATGKLTLFEALQYHDYKLASDPRDLIYGLAGITTAAGSSGLELDYSQTVAQVYANFARFEISTSQSVELLIRVKRGGPLDDELPSWAPDWSFRTGHAYLQDIRTPSFDYAASRHSKAIADFSGDGTILTTKCVNIGSIATVGQATGMKDRNDMKRIIVAFHQWRSLIGKMNGDWLQNQEAFARTLICNRITAKGLENWTSSEHFQGVLGTFADLSTDVCPDLQLDKALTEFAAQRPLRSKEKAEEKGNVYDEVGSRKMWRNWTNIGAAYMWDRCFIITSTGHMGLVPAMAMEGDIVSVPLGCSSPILFRPVGKHYTVLGEAYIDGMMYGEAMDLLEAGVLELQDFELH